MQNNPLTAAGSRELKHPRPIAPKVRAAVKLMVYGRLDDPDCKPLSFIEAARLSGVRPDVMRRYLDRPDVRALLSRERKAFRAAICAGNEGALADVRDRSANAMARVAAVRVLEALDDADGPLGAHGSTAPGVTIVIADARADAPPVTVDGRSISAPYVTLPREPEAMPPDLDPVFRAPGKEPHR